MNKSIFASSEDPWENGWAAPNDDDNINNNINSSTLGNNSSSAYLSSQLLSGETSHQSTPETLSTNPLAIPQSYKSIYTHLSSKVNSVNELQIHIFNRLEKVKVLSTYQTTRIIDILYDHDILPPSTETNFWQVLGLIALEIDYPGSGDFVTLQFRLNTQLPDLSQYVVNLLISDDESQNNQEDVIKQIPDSEFIDPLTAQLGLSTISDDVEWNGRPNNHNASNFTTTASTTNNSTSGMKSNKEHSILSDPILTDHSSIQHKQDHTDQISGDTAQEPIDFSQITRYIHDIRDKFKPLVNTPDQVKIKEVPEKDGFLFKHINYIITHDLKLGLHGPAGTKKVIRRYSDFVWLLEYLLQKYPFRVIPGLPPKKFSGM